MILVMVYSSSDKSILTYKDLSKFHICTVNYTFTSTFHKIFYTTEGNTVVNASLRGRLP